MLDKMVAEQWIEARAVIGLFPANSVGDDDIAVYADAMRSQHARRCCITCASNAASRRVNRTSCLADFIAPARIRRRRLHRCLCRHRRHRRRASRGGVRTRAHDDYSAILLKALADRLAEAGAEYLHSEVRKVYWGYARGRVAVE